MNDYVPNRLLAYPKLCIAYRIEKEAFESRGEISILDNEDHKSVLNADRENVLILKRGISLPHDIEKGTVGMGGGSKCRPAGNGGMVLIHGEALYIGEYARGSA